MDKIIFLKKFLGEHNYENLKKNNKALTDDNIFDITINTLQIIKQNTKEFVRLFDRNYSRANFTTLLKDETRDFKAPLSTELNELITGRLIGIFVKINQNSQDFITNYINILLDSLQNPQNITIDENDFELSKEVNYSFSNRKDLTTPVINE